MSGYGGANNDADSDQVRCPGQAGALLPPAPTKEGVGRRGRGEPIWAGHVCMPVNLLCPFLAPGGLVRLVVIVWRSASNHCWPFGFAHCLFIQTSDAFHFQLLMRSASCCFVALKKKNVFLRPVLVRSRLFPASFWWCCFVHSGCDLMAWFCRLPTAGLP